MTPEKLAEIKRNWHSWPVTDLIAEIERLQAELKPLRKVETWTIGFLERWERAIREELGRMKGQRSE